VHETKTVEVVEHSALMSFTIGTCLVTKISKDKPAKPDYFEHILKVYPDGTPCQSSVFTDVPDISVRKNQVEIGLCQRACPPSM